ncbi:AAA family ATPase [Pseudoduganella danionis]|uniref:AAA family ATPase n=2 Tax=Telluria group TaxID=2895353 RepID=A0ABW9STR8_9BURK|nr:MULTISPECIES: ParA family protein [Telluria group]MTW35410.1 AAA family ATPase [Pseudoduganella danionis]MYM41920.1 AAA family ATPase [Duganella qianjiadongensis]
MTAKIVTIFNQKGGCAKTMTTMQVGGTWGMLGLKVCIIDMDPQNTAKLWSLQATAEAPFPAEVLNFAPLGKNFIHKVEQLVDKYDVILVDCPPAIESPVPWTSLLIADYAVIPVIPVLDNVWASKIAEDLIIKARDERPNEVLGATYLLSVMRKGKVFDTCLDSLKEDSKLPIMNSKVGMRNAYPECQAYGCSVGAFGASVAKNEIEAVAYELANQVGLNLKKPKAAKK